MKPTIIAAGIVVIAVTGFAWNRYSTSPTADRHQIAVTAIESGASVPNWPADEAALIHEFWGAVSGKNWDRVLMFCPGSTERDFAVFAAMPPGPVGGIAAPEDHPTEAGVKLWPVRVPFSGFPNKVIKMAFFRTEDGRLCVDGRYTIWW